MTNKKNIFTDNEEKLRKKIRNSHDKSAKHHRSNDEKEDRKEQ